MKTYFKLTVEIWDFEWEHTEVFFFKSREDAENERKDIDKRLTNKNFYIDEVSFDQMKEEITVEAFEELFGIKIEDPTE